MAGMGLRRHMDIQKTYQGAMYFWPNYQGFFFCILNRPLVGLLVMTLPQHTVHKSTCAQCTLPQHTVHSRVGGLDWLVRTTPKCHVWFHLEAPHNTAMVLGRVLGLDFI